MKIVSIIILVIIALFFLLPILWQPEIIPEDISPWEIGKFIWGFVQYWVEALTTAFATE